MDVNIRRGLVVCALPLVILAMVSVLVGCQALPASSAQDASTGSNEVTGADTSSMDLDYTERDQDSGYDPARSASIVLSDQSATVSGSGVQAEGTTVTISQEGTYVVSGSCTDGQIVIDAGESDKVQVVLSDVTLANSDGPALLVSSADKVFVTLADGTHKALEDGASYALDGTSDEPDATVFSTADLTFNGSGSLSVTGSYANAIKSKDDLVFCGGSYEVSAVTDCLHGTDCVKVQAGSFQLDAGRDGIKSSKDDDSSKGYVSITGGTFDITASDDGMQAQTLLRVSDGSLTISAADDGLHSELEASVEGGSLSVVAGDDGVHADDILTVSGGTTDVSAYEGLEAEQVYITGGTNHVTASDDGVNAATTSDSTDAQGEVKGQHEGAADPGQDTGAGMPANVPQQVPSSQDAPGQPGAQEPTGAVAGGDTSGADPRQTDAGSCLVQVDGGYTVVDAGGDGIDSNGDFTIDGGVLLVSGSTDGGNEAIDCQGEARTDGGTLLATGSSGMAEDFDAGSQPFFTVTTASEVAAGQNVAVTDEEGDVLVSFTSPKSFDLVQASAPGMSEGEAVRVVIGGVVDGADDDGFASGGTASGGSSVDTVCRTTSSYSGGGQPGSKPTRAGA